MEKAKQVELLQIQVSELQEELCAQKKTHHSLSSHQSFFAG
jgi:hypothetical protein